MYILLKNMYKYIYFENEECEYFYLSVLFFSRSEIMEYEWCFTCFLNLTISWLNTYLTHFINCRKLLTFSRMSYCNDKLSFASLSEYNYFTNVFSCIKHYSNELHIFSTSSDISNELKQRNHLTVCIYYFH